MLLLLLLITDPVKLFGVACSVFQILYIRQYYTNGEFFIVTCSVCSAKCQIHLSIVVR